MHIVFDKKKSYVEEELKWGEFFYIDDEFKPLSDEGSSDDEGSSGENEEDISEPETESEVDSPVKVEELS